MIDFLFRQYFRFGFQSSTDCILDTISFLALRPPPAYRRSVCLEAAEAHLLLLNANFNRSTKTSWTASASARLRMRQKANWIKRGRVASMTAGPFRQDVIG